MQRGDACAVQAYRYIAALPLPAAGNLAWAGSTRSARALRVTTAV